MHHVPGDSRRTIYSAFRTSVSALCLIALAAYLYAYRAEIWPFLTSVDTGLLIMAVGSVAAQFACRAWRDRILFLSLGHRVPATAIQGIHARQALLNYLPLKAGTVYAVAEIRNRYGIRFASVGAVFAAQNIFTLAATFVVAAVTLLAMDPSRHLPTAAGLLVLGLLSLAGLLVRVPKGLKLPQSVRQHCELAHEGMDLLIAKWRYLLAVSAISLLIILITAWRFQVLSAAGGTRIDYGVGILFAASAYASVFVAVSPASLGIREGMMAATASAMSLAGTTGAAVSMLDRLVVLIYCGAVIAVGCVASLTRKRSA